MQFRWTAWPSVCSKILTSSALHSVIACYHRDRVLVYTAHLSLFLSSPSVSPGLCVSGRGGDGPWPPVVCALWGPGVDGGGCLPAHLHVPALLPVLWAPPEAGDGPGEFRGHRGRSGWCLMTHACNSPQNLTKLPQTQLRLVPHRSYSKYSISSITVGYLLP